jgi:hypothetical protein
MLWSLEERKKVLRVTMDKCLPIKNESGSRNNDRFCRFH